MGQIIAVREFEEVSGFTTFIERYNLQKQFLEREGINIDEWTHEEDDQSMISTYIELYLKGFYILDYIDGRDGDYFTIQKIILPSKKEQIMEAI